MPLDLYLAFVLASVVLIVIPGPNVALIVANSVAHGGRFGLLAVAGTSGAVVVHLTLTVLGASVVLNVLAASFDARGLLVGLTNPKTLLFSAPSCRSSSRPARRRPISSCCWP